MGWKTIYQTLENRDNADEVERTALFYAIGKTHGWGRGIIFGTRLWNLPIGGGGRATKGIIWSAGLRLKKVKIEFLIC